MVVDRHNSYMTMQSDLVTSEWHLMSCVTCEDHMTASYYQTGISKRRKTNIYKHRFKNHPLEPHKH